MLPRSEVHALWSEPTLATWDQVEALAAEVLRWRVEVLDRGDEDHDCDDPDCQRCNHVGAP